MNGLFPGLNMVRTGSWWCWPPVNMWSKGPACGLGFSIWDSFRSPSKPRNICNHISIHYHQPKVGFGQCSNAGRQSSSIMFDHVGSCLKRMFPHVPSCSISCSITTKMFDHFHNVNHCPSMKTIKTIIFHHQTSIETINFHHFPHESSHLPSISHQNSHVSSFSHHFPMISPWFSHDFPKFPHQNSHLWTTGPPSEASFCRQLSQEVHPSVAGTVDLDPTGSTWECSSIWIYYLTSNCTNQLSIRFFWSI